MPEVHYPNDADWIKCPRCGQLYINICYNCGYSDHPQVTNVSGAVMDSTIAASGTLDIASQAIPSIDEQYNTLPPMWQNSLDYYLQTYLTPFLESRQRINLLFKLIYKEELFRFTGNDPFAITTFITECTDEKDFNDKIQHLAIIITNIKEEVLRNLIKNANSIQGSLNLFEAFLKEKYPKRDISAIKTLRNIQTLRSMSYPIHDTGIKYLRALKQLGISYPPDSWQVEWEKVLNQCRESFIQIEFLLKSRVT